MWPAIKKSFGKLGILVENEEGEQKFVPIDECIVTAGSERKGVNGTVNPIYIDNRLVTWGMAPNPIQLYNRDSDNYLLVPTIRHKEEYEEKLMYVSRRISAHKIITPNMLFEGLAIKNLIVDGVPNDNAKEYIEDAINSFKQTNVVFNEGDIYIYHNAPIK